MALRVGERAIHPLTAAQVLRMAEVGILDEDAPVELLDGVLTQVSPKTPEHGEALRRLVVWLDPTRNAGRFRVLTEHPLAVPDRTSLPEPDVAVLDARHDPRRHPVTALLVVEVAASSQATDLGRKSELYAAAGVPEYWVVDLPGRRVHVLREPRDGRFRAVAVHGRNAAGSPTAVAPAAVDVPPLDVSLLFDGL
jgi:Uma2 family endonuclease